MKKAVILDRDGTINVEGNYIWKFNDFIWIPGAKESIKKLKDAGYLIIVASNQSGIARGFFSEEDVKRLHKEINESLKMYSTCIDKFYYCPHYPKGKKLKYSFECECRKPADGMFRKAIQDYDIDVAKSWAVGDRIRDVEPAQKLGFKTALVETGYGQKEKMKGVICFKDIAEFSNYILNM